MGDATRYVMLLTSLPYHGPLFGATQTPLSRLRLDRRLRLLRPDHAADLQRARTLIEFAQQDATRSDADFVATARAMLAAIEHPFVRDLVTRRLELRTLIAALRRQQRGEPAPTDNDWGIGDRIRAIRQHWDVPGFGLDRIYPWLPAARRALASGAALELERLLGGVAWQQLERVSQGHHFDFEAVVIYVLRWDMVASWTGYDGTAAMLRFDELVAAAMGEVERALHRRLQPVEPAPEPAPAPART